MKRILVIGTSGSGKSTFAQKLSNCLNLPFFASDPFYWEPGWKIASSEKVRQQLLNVVHRELWILDGNFDHEHEWVWKQADCIIWLDYSFTTVFRRIVSRNFRWLFTRQQIWSGNQMTLPRAISGIRHAIKSYAQKKQDYPRWLGEFSSITQVRFRTSAEAETWLKNLQSESDTARVIL